MAGVDALHDHHTWVPPQPPGQLPIANIDSIHAGRTMLKEAIGEPPGRCTDICGHHSAHIEAKCLQGSFQLQATSTDITEPLLNGKYCVTGHPRAGFVDHLTVHKDLSSHDHAAGSFAALR